MRMRITPKFTKADIERDLQKLSEAIYKITLLEFIRVGLEIVRDARLKKPMEDFKGNGTIGSDTPGFNDQTGNLRNSEGFIVMHDGKEVHQDFTKSASELGDEGLAKGREYASQVAQEHPKGWAIIIVAGMEYASWVEGLGYDVITGSTLDAPDKMRQATENIKRAIETYVANTK